MNGIVLHWLTTKYMSLMSSRLQRYKKSGSGFNFRCPLCGDSKKSATKARGWVFENATDRNAVFHCHNCHKTLSFQNFIKVVDQTLYYEYVKDCMIDRAGGEVHPTHEFANKMKKPVFVNDTALKELRKISQLEDDHPALKYVKKRQIPSQYHYKLFFAPKFKTWVNRIIPDKFNDYKDEPRLIIPFLDRDKKLFGFQGRSFRSKDDLKYITIMLDESKPKLFGLEDLDDSRLVTVTEGPIDAMFLPNCIASCGGKLDTNLECTGIRKHDTLLVYDNEPRSPETVRKISDAIDSGWKVTVWPDDWPYKDINDAVLGGVSPGKLADLVRENSYMGLSARLRLATWRKCA